MSFKVLLVLLLTIALASDPVSIKPMLGQVIVKGQAKINGLATASGANIFPGDQMTTEAGTVAEVFLDGGNNVLLPESSAVVIHQDGTEIIVNLKQGALAVFSKNGSPAIIEGNGVLIRPATVIPATIEVAVRENSLKVVARRGSAIVETADKSIEVTEGKELDATVAPDPPQGPTGARKAGRSKLMTWVLIAAVGAGITGLVLGVEAFLRPSPTDCSFVSTTGRIVCP